MNMKYIILLTGLAGFFLAGCGGITEPGSTAVSGANDTEETGEAEGEAASEEGEMTGSTESDQSEDSDSVDSGFTDLTGTWCSHFDENDDGIPENGCEDYASFLRLGEVDERPTAWAFLFECEDGAFDSEIRFENDRLFIELDTTSYTQEFNSCRGQRIFLDLVTNGTDLVGKITLVNGQGESSTRSIVFSKESSDPDYFPPFIAKTFENPKLPRLAEREDYRGQEQDIQEEAFEELPCLDRKVRCNERECRLIMKNSTCGTTALICTPHDGCFDPNNGDSHDLGICPQLDYLMSDFTEHEPVAVSPKIHCGEQAICRRIILCAK